MRTRTTLALLVFFSFTLVGCISTSTTPETAPSPVTSPQPASMGPRAPRHPAPPVADIHVSVPDRDPLFTKATATFGPPIVREGVYDYQAAWEPWSSWWYPIRETTLFQDSSNGLSPLQKYDAYVQATRRGMVLPHGDATSFEREKIYDPDADKWEGLCNAWAAASILESEPTKPVKAAGIDFTVADLKALLVKSYEVVDGLEPFGQRYNGDSASLYEDIYPDQFLRVIQHEIGEKHRPIIMDIDPGVPVWNMPFWYARVRLARAPGDPHLMHGEFDVSEASPYVKPDFVGTVPIGQTYTFDFLVDPQADGSFVVRYGVWTGHTVDDHPDFVTVLPQGKAQHRSKNLALDSQIVTEILGAGGS